MAMTSVLLVSSSSEHASVKLQTWAGFMSKHKQEGFLCDFWRFVELFSRIVVSHRVVQVGLVQ